MKIVSYSEINKRIKSNPKEFIRECCKNYDIKCKKLAEKIAENVDEHPIILLSGPSGSGKTTTAYKIEGYLKRKGLVTHTISMDNYFLPKDQINIFDENNKIDYESPYRIDIPLLQDHMMRLANYEEVDVPIFDFPSQDRAGSKKLRLKKGELALFEGIHALNPEVTGHEDFSTGLYISVRTRIELSDGKLVHPELIRLMRRIIRDRNFRNRAPAETLDMFDSVQRGEDLYIMPYKNRAQFQIDSFQPFEPALYRDLIVDDIKELSEIYPDFERFAPISQLLCELVSLSLNDLPTDSLPREFIGGSSYEY